MEKIYGHGLLSLDVFSFSSKNNYITCRNIELRFYIMAASISSLSSLLMYKTLTL